MKLYERSEKSLKEDSRAIATSRVIAGCRIMEFYGILIMYNFMSLPQ